MAKFPLRNCTLCSYASKRSTSLEKHIQSSHGIEPQKAYVDAFHGGVWPVCKCSCGKKLQWNGWKNGFSAYILGHNSHNVTDEVKQKRVETLRQNIKTGTVKNWNTGLTKQTDKRIAHAAKKQSDVLAAAFNSGQRIQWNKDLTAKTDVRVAKASVDSRERFAAGQQVPWTKGKTKTTDPRIKAMADNVRRSLSDPNLQLRLSTLKKLSNVEVSRRIALIENDMVFVGNVITDYKGINEETLAFLCERCQKTEIRSLYAMGRNCSTCYPAGSIQQNEIKRFIKQLSGYDAITTRDIISPYELDLYIDEAKLAIEFNGLWWHTDEKKNDKSYHSRKTELCRLKGIRLLHVFSDEWRDKQEIVKSMIASRLGVCDIKIDARKCSVIELDRESARKYFSNNHIDGYTRAQKSWGLNYKGVIVAAISIRRPHHATLSSYIEIARFCSSLNHNVRGALGKLIKVVQQHTNKPILSYVDQRHGDGHSYEKLNFKKERETQERFWWTDCIHRFDRFTFRANKSENKSEQLVADEKAIFRLFGCKNSVYTLHQTNQSYQGQVVP